MHFVISVFFFSQNSVEDMIFWKGWDICPFWEYYAQRCPVARSPLSPAQVLWVGLEGGSEYLPEVTLDALAPNGHLPVISGFWEVPTLVHKVIN